MKWRERLVETLAIAAETGWIYGAALVLTALADDGDPPSYPALLALSGLAFLLVRLLGHVEARSRGLVIGFAALSLLLVYVVARLEYARELRVYDLRWFRDLLAEPATVIGGRGWIPLGIAIMIGVWLRNASRALAPLDFEAVLRSFSVGFAVLVIAAIAAGPLEKSAQETGLLLPVFAGYLLALALAQSLRVDVEGRAASRLSWFALMVGLTALLVGLAFGAGLVLESSLGDVVAPVGTAVRVVAAAVVYGLSLPVFFALYGFLRLILFLSGRTEKDVADSLNLANQNLRDAVTNPEQASGEGASDWLLVAFRAAQIAIAAVILLLVLIWLYRRGGRASQRGNEARESVFSAGALKRDLRNFVTNLFRNPLPPPGPTTEIGRLYADVVAEAARRGIERAPALTPLQFAPELLVRFESRVPLEISHLYAAYAYGRIEPARGRVDELHSAWSEVTLSHPPA